MKKDFYWALLKRIASSILVLFLLVTFIFLLVRLAPGDPTQKFLSPQLSPQLAEKVSISFGLDQPILTQYFSFVVNIFSGDFGAQTRHDKEGEQGHEQIGAEVKCDHRGGCESRASACSR